jgi:histidinol-phosphatase
MDADWRERYDAAREAAREAGQFALRHFDQGIAVEWKADESPVTAADRGAEQLLRTTLLQKFPTDGFLGEEFGDTPGTSGFRWIIDPIDGTRSFVRGIPLWATLVGLEYKGEQIAGVAYIPPLDTMYHALRGAGCYRGDRRLHVSAIDTLEKAHLYYSSVNWFRRVGADERFLKLYHAVERQRGFGDFYGFVLVAQGAGELMIDHGVHAWDVAALIPILEEAGGTLTDWAGNVTIDAPDVIASNGRLHDDALRYLRGEV